MEGVLRDKTKITEKLGELFVFVFIPGIRRDAFQAKEVKINLGIAQKTPPPPGAEF